MKKKISVLLALVLALSLALIGCGGEGNNGENASGSVAGTDSGAGADSGSDSTSAEDEDGPRDGYLDEATGIWHTTLYYNDHMPISYAMPDGWSKLTDGLGKGSFDSIYTDATLDNTMQDEDSSFFNIWSNWSEDGAQAVYDSMNDSGFLGESHEVTYGNNTYISNVTPTEYETTYFFYTGKPEGPIVYVYGVVTDTNKAAFEEVLSTLTY